jgi:hypothetical protein
LVAFDLTELDTLTREAKEHLARGGGMPEEVETQVATKLEIVSAALAVASRALRDCGNEMRDRLHESLGIVTVAVHEALTRYTRLKG